MAILNYFYIFFSLLILNQPDPWITYDENENFLISYKLKRCNDIKNGFDFNFYLHNKKSKDVLSRGQQKLLILLTFLSINDFFYSLNSPGSILLIDDLTSELDHENLKLFLQEVPKQKNQIIMTDIDASNSLKKDKIADTFEKIII